MSEAARTVLTIGHSTHSLAAFVALLRRYDVTAVADVRSTPYSRFNPQFNREPFAEALAAEAIRYVYLGDTLGGRSDDPACYEDGRIRYARIAASEPFRRGLDRVVRGAARHRIALMCAEKEPLDCHRTLLVAPALEEQGVAVTHIRVDHAGSRLEPHRAAMDRLLDLVSLPRGDLLDEREGLVAAAIAWQEARVAYVDGGRAAAARTSEQSA